MIESCWAFKHHWLEPPMIKSRGILRKLYSIWSYWFNHCTLGDKWYCQNCSCNHIGFMNVVFNELLPGTKRNSGMFTWWALHEKCWNTNLLFVLKEVCGTHICKYTPKRSKNILMYYNSVAFIMHEYQAMLNSLAPRRSNVILNVIFNLVLLIGIFKSSDDDVLRWMPQDLTDDKSTLVKVIAWCRQATSKYLNQCWPGSPTPYGVTRPQWVKWVRVRYHSWCAL